MIGYILGPHVWVVGILSTPIQDPQTENAQILIFALAFLGTAATLPLAGPSENRYWHMVLMLHCIRGI